MFEKHSSASASQPLKLNSERGKAMATRRPLWLRR